MNNTAQKILNNKSDYRRNLQFLDKKYNGAFSKKLNNEKNDINILSLFSEMEFGYILNDLFEDVFYEPIINGKRPDWLVKSNGENLIFEVKKLNPLESELNSRIDLFKENKYYGITQTSFQTSINNFIPQLYRIASKEEAYRELVLSGNYKLIVCIDVINLHKDFITDNDLREFLNFEDKLSAINEYQNFSENVTGILGKPIFGNLVFIENKSSNFKLNNTNLKIMNTI